ncbi:M15 family metallopeptidase [Actinoplanes subtropicus]|uniref:M15 family metallopeptidase n=1 Tax=Actinoplanes subtropicus TaxID=543632 RepID=UPI0004C3371B|nr:M15 family metallopeptidase [Actinoplanes subtropicus]
MRKLLAVLLALVVPATVLPGRPAAAASSVWHVVAPGETMGSIARDFGLSAEDIGRWNQIVAPYPVHVDETLRLTPPVSPLPPWHTRIDLVTPAMVSWNPALHCPVPPSALRRVWVSYIDLQGAYHDGSIIVHRDVAVRVQNIFLTLFRWRYRIMAMAPMSVNMPGETDMGIVTAGYNCRPVGGTDVWSEHAYGTAIDINPLQNPMIRGGSVSPAAGRYYLDRSRYLIGMIHPEGAGRAFTGNGYFWGGQWRNLKDYMHFSVTNR